MLFFYILCGCKRFVSRIKQAEEREKALKIIAHHKGVSMATKDDLIEWLYEALKYSKGRGTIAKLCRIIWENHEQDLRKSGDLFYTWQYDVRWAAYQLRKEGRLKPIDRSPKGVWELSS